MPSCTSAISSATALPCNLTALQVHYRDSIVHGQRQQVRLGIVPRVQARQHVTTIVTILVYLAPPPLRCQRAACARFGVQLGGGLP